MKSAQTHVNQHIYCIVLHYYFLLTWPLPMSMPKVISELFHALVVDFISTIIIIADVWNYFTDEICHYIGMHVIVVCQPLALGMADCSGNYQLYYRYYR